MNCAVQTHVVVAGLDRQIARCGVEYDAGPTNHAVGANIDGIISDDTGDRPKTSGGGHVSAAERHTACCRFNRQPAKTLASAGGSGPDVCIEKDTSDAGAENKVVVLGCLAINCGRAGEGNVA